MNLAELSAWLKVILLMVLVIAGGMFALNQTFGWYYKAEFLKTPCQLCIELNPNFTRCGIELAPNLQNQYNNLDWSKINITTIK